MKVYDDKLKNIFGNKIALHSIRHVFYHIRKQKIARKIFLIFIDDKFAEKNCKKEKWKRNSEPVTSDEMNYIFFFFISLDILSPNYISLSTDISSRVSAINFNYPEVNKEWKLDLIKKLRLGIENSPGFWNLSFFWGQGEMLASCRESSSKFLSWMHNVSHSL